MTMGSVTMALYLHGCHCTPTTNVIVPSMESSVKIPVAEDKVLVNRTCELTLSGRAAPQGEKMVEVNGMLSEIS